MEKKICTKCKIPKSIDEFFKSKSFKDNLHCWCKKCNSEYKKGHYRINLEKIKKRNKQWRKNNPEKNRNCDKKYHQKNIEELKKYQKKYKKNRYNNDPIFRLNQNIKNAVGRSLRGNKNGQSWGKLVGYDCQELKEHLERQFKDGMTWENYGKWEVDHRIPVSIFNITGVKSKGFKKAWELENLQPMWASENISKSNKLFH